MFCFKKKWVLFGLKSRVLHCTSSSTSLFLGMSSPPTQLSPPYDPQGYRTSMDNEIILYDGFNVICYFIIFRIHCYIRLLPKLRWRIFISSCFMTILILRTYILLETMHIKKSQKSLYQSSGRCMVNVFPSVQPNYKPLWNHLILKTETDK